MPAPKTRAVSAKGMIEYRPRIARGLPNGCRVNCADNTGAKELKVIQVLGHHSRLRRVPSACVGDMVMVSVSKGTPDLRRQMFPAVVVRQVRAFKRPDGTRLSFHDNAAVIMTPEGELKGTEIRGPVAKEAAERWPRVANLASIII
ncbi:MAG TPA: 50S ribosomal protein L14 [Candidatus Acidoferrales bacterium]|nr:50S ribosomal protein L14 [Candidatus Acidoferrales bacterium]